MVHLHRQPRTGTGAAQHRGEIRIAAAYRRVSDAVLVHLLHAEQAIAHLPGVIRAYVNPLTEMAYVEIDPTTASEDQIVAAVAHLGLRPGRPVAR